MGFLVDLLYWAQWAVPVYLGIGVVSLFLLRESFRRSIELANLELVKKWAEEGGKLGKPVSRIEIFRAAIVCVWTWPALAYCYILDTFGGNKKCGNSTT